MSTLTITGIQTALHWENASANRKMFEEKINSITDKTEIIIIPETFSTGFSMKPKDLGETMDGETVKWMKKEDQQGHCSLQNFLLTAKKWRM